MNKCLPTIQNYKFVSTLQNWANIIFKKNMFEVNKGLIRFQNFYYRGAGECDRRKLYLLESINYFQLNILYC